MSETAGYSSKKLAEKLGVNENVVIWSPMASDWYWRELGPVKRTNYPTNATLWHIFLTKQAELDDFAKNQANDLPKKAALWMSWPKRSAQKDFGVPSDVTEQAFRDALLPLGLVDVKVCAVNDVWSGLKFVWRKR